MTSGSPYGPPVIFYIITAIQGILEQLGDHPALKVTMFGYVSGPNKALEAPQSIGGLQRGLNEESQAVQGASKMPRKNPSQTVGE